MSSEEVPTLTKEQISLMLRKGDPHITLYDKKDDRRNKSPVWDSFKIICYQKKKLEFVICNICSDILPYKGCNTSSLGKHKCRKVTSQLTLDSFFSTRPVPKHVIDQLNRDITIGLALDLRPLSSVERRGFKMIAQSLINLGAMYGAQKVDNVLQSRKTLKDKHLTAVVDENKQEIVQMLQSSPSFPKFSFTMDLWSDSYQHENYLSFCVHFLDKNFQLQQRLLALEQFPHLPKTTDNIREVCEGLLKDYFGSDVSKVVDSSICVTDGGSNVINVFPNRLPCLCHRMNLMVTWMFNEKLEKKPNPLANPKKKFIFSEKCPTFHSTVDAVKGIVTYFKQSSLNAELKTTLKKDMPTRWNSKLIMLKSYMNSKVQVKQLLLEKYQLEKAYPISDTALAELVNFLDLFMKCTEAWSKEKTPTIHEVAKWTGKLESHLVETELDSEELKVFKEQARLCFTEYFDLDDLYYVARVFHPGGKKLTFLDPEKRTRIFTVLRGMIDLESSRISDRARDDERNSKTTGHLLHTNDEYFDPSESDDEESVKLHELDAYLKTPASKEEKSDAFDVLQYWRDIKHFPRMRSLASWLLAVPASQTSDETVFSSTGATLTPRRTELNGKTLAGLTFIHKNL